jgi:hypothetical protein
MSSMLEQAIIDAKELKEAAQQNAQEAVIERYQKEIKEAVDKILEQEDLGMDPAMGGEDLFGGGMAMDPGAAAAPAAPDVPAGEPDDPQVEKVLSQLSFLQTGDDDDYVDLNLSKLEEVLNIRAEDIFSRIEDNLISENLLSELGLFEVDLEEAEDDLYESDDPVKRANVEKDSHKRWKAKEAAAKRECAGEWKPGTYKNIDDKTPGHCEKTRKYEKVTKLEESKRIERKNKSLLKEQTKLNKKAHLLEEKLDKYGTIINKLKNKLNESSLQNAKLLYQNRVLDSISLNERQKDKIVEAIHNTNSVEEAKIIFETLQSTVGSVKSKPRKAPESLNEVVTRSSSAFIPRKEEKREDNNPFAERMKTLAGLK